MVDFLTPLLFSVIAGAATGIGGLIGIYKRLSMKYFDMAIGFAAGVMLAVATLGLINEGIILLNGGYTALIITITVISGVALGMIVLLIIDRVLPHLHTLIDSSDRKEECKKVVCAQECKCPNKDKWFECPYLEDGICRSAGNCFCPRKLEFQKHLKYSGILLAIGLTIHNAPEGIAMGVGFLATSALGFSMAIAIALHNIPEGLAIAVPLMQAKYGRRKIFLISFFSGMAEPIACVIAIFLLQSVSTLFLAFFLAFAGGAMIYITSDELIPESHKHGYEHQATIGLLLGFILMLMLIIGFQI
ncbi:MAG TPA: ZIP family metal transporter [Candidatus Deferrimicrobium sp.]|nr:ZIP family metal transporter [Candidatus Deferrimicrobium sp.]